MCGSYIHVIVYSLVLFWLYAGDTQEDAGCSQHARAVQHGDETH